MKRDYEIIATEAGYLVFVTDQERRYALGARPYPSLTRARDQIPKRYRASARLIHASAYTELINTSTALSPPLSLPIPSATHNKIT